MTRRNLALKVLVPKGVSPRPMLLLSKTMSSKSKKSAKILALKGLKGLKTIFVLHKKDLAFTCQ